MSKKLAKFAKNLVTYSKMYSVQMTSMPQVICCIANYGNPMSIGYTKTLLNV